MSAAQPMPPARRRAIPGMRSTRPAPPPPSPIGETDSVIADGASAEGSDPSGLTPAAAASAETESRERPGSSPQSTRRHPAVHGAQREKPGRWPAADYSATRLVNFRLPVDLHDRYKQLVRDTERHHPRLRHPRLTELVIALLEEGPGTVDEVAELIRRKRAAEHQSERRQ